MNLSLAKQALKQYFGYDSFRPMQAEIIQAVYDKKDCLVLMPTGGGKSICFQIPAVTLEGIAIVVSPLISLMKDQVQALKANGIAAAFLNSSISLKAQSEITDLAHDGHVKLLYVSPERLLSQEFSSFMRQLKINLIAIDEAHCISAWGHDFRPEYTQMSYLKSSFPNVPIIALTATADKITRRDISSQLNLKEPESFVASFDRPNLSLTVLPGRNRIQTMLHFIKSRPDSSGIVYCLSRKNTEQVAAKLQSAGFQADFYHAGRSASERDRVQEAFIKDDLPIVCATVAFGMGIDKSNVRWVIHYNLPKNIESYYQEIGRAGRDGVASDTILFYSYQDIIMLQKILGDNKQAALKLAKLDRMQQYADAAVCRRRVLLSYFGEHLTKDCGNCDVCKNPPERFDGSVLAQKALSAIARLKERVGMRMLIDVLRGSHRKELLERGYHKIKTYGAGANIDQRAWQEFMLQMLNMGLFEIAYDEGSTLRLTDLSRDVLFKGQKVELVRLKSAKQRMEERVKRAKPKSKKEQLAEDLFGALRKLRLRLAKERGLAPYLVFSDATLEEMAAKRPTTESQMRDVSGVGVKKMQEYGFQFMTEIVNWVIAQHRGGTRMKGATYLETFSYYRQQLTIEEISQKRKLNPITIYSHLAYLYEKGYPVEILGFIPAENRNKILQAIQETGETETLKPLFDHMNEEVPFHQIRLMLSYYKKEYKERTE